MGRLESILTRYFRITTYVFLSLSCSGRFQVEARDADEDGEDGLLSVAR
jgi:hypothetical protein